MLLRIYESRVAESGDNNAQAAIRIKKAKRRAKLKTPKGSDYHG